jgi:tripartite-type tricarboxylate transporter receptor subunit TctC
LVRAKDMGVQGRERPDQLDANMGLMTRLEAMRLQAGVRMGLGDVSNSVIPKPVLVSEGDSNDSIVSRYFTPKRCHASHAVTGAIGVATAFALPGTVASGAGCRSGQRAVTVLHPVGQIDVEVRIGGEGTEAQIEQAALVRTARKIFQGELHLPTYVFPVAPAEPLNVSVQRPTDQPDSPTEGQRTGYAKRPIRLIVPTVAGGANDTVARLIARRLGPLLGQNVIIDNRSGANGSIASEYVAKAAPDGHTLLFGYVATHAMNPALGRLRYDPITDFSPIGRVGISPTLLVVNPSLTISNVRDLVAQLQHQPNLYRYASAGDGTAPHFAAELFQLATGTKMSGVSHSGSAPAIADTAKGHSQLMFPSWFTASPFISTGAVKPLAIAGQQRLVGLPHVPTLREAGIEGVDVTQWYALFAPAHTPSTIIHELNQALNEVLQDTELAARTLSEGLEVQPSSPEQLHRLLLDERQKWQDVVNRAGLMGRQTDNDRPRSFNE